MGNGYRGMGYPCNGHMGSGVQGYVAHGQWGTGGMGPIDNGVQGYGAHGESGTGGMRYRGYGSHGQ